MKVNFKVPFNINDTLVERTVIYYDVTMMKDQKSILNQRSAVGHTVKYMIITM